MNPSRVPFYVSSYDMLIYIQDSKTKKCVFYNLQNLNETDFYRRIHAQ